MADIGKLNVEKAFEAIARILSEREHVEIRVKEIRKKKETKEDPA